MTKPKPKPKASARKKKSTAERAARAAAAIAGANRAKAKLDRFKKPAPMTRRQRDDLIASAAARTGTMIGLDLDDAINRKRLEKATATYVKLLHQEALTAIRMSPDGQKIA